MCVNRTRHFLCGGWCFECCYCVQPHNRAGEPVSNIIFLPEPLEIKDCFWDILSDRMPEAAETRYLVLTLLVTEGERFTDAKSADDLANCFTHSIVGVLFHNPPFHLHNNYTHQQIPNPGLAWFGWL